MCWGCSGVVGGLHLFSVFRVYESRVSFASEEQHALMPTAERRAYTEWRGSFRRHAQKSIEGGSFESFGLQGFRPPDSESYREHSVACPMSTGPSHSREGHEPNHPEPGINYSQCRP